MNRPTLLLLVIATLMTTMISVAIAQEGEEIDLGAIEVVGAESAADDSLGGDPEIDLGAVNVEGQAAPASKGSTATTVIERSQFGSASTVAEVLERVPGIDVRSLGGFGQLSAVHIRGARSNQALVLIDGLPVSSGTADLSTLPIGLAERIEVYRGPGAARFGGGALGGVVNIVTTAPTAATAAGCDEGDATEVTLSLGTYGYQEQSIVHRSGDTSLYLSHSAADNDFSFVRPGGPEVTRQNNEARIVQGWLGFVDDHANYSVGLSDLRRGVPGSAEFPTLRADLHVSRLMLSRSSSSQQTGLRLENTRFTDPEPFLAGGPIETDDTLVHLEHSFTATSGTASPLRLKPRLDYTDSSGYGEKQRLGIDASWQRDWADNSAQYSLELGAVATEGIGIDPALRGGVAVDVGGGAELFSSLGVSTRHPEFDELYLANIGSVRGNPQLKPERVISVDAGLRLKGGSTYFETAAFWSDYHDSIVFAPVSAYAVEASNTGPATVAGLELLLDQHLGGDCWWRTSYSWLPLAEYDSGVPLAGRAEHHANSRLELASRGWSGELEFDYTGEIPADLFGNLVIEPRSLVNLGIERELRHGSVGLSISNLFDESARDSWNYPLPGREIKATWRIEL